MIQAMPGKVVIKKINVESRVRDIYLNTINCYYQIESVMENDFNLQIGDKVVVEETKIYKIIHDNSELGIIDINDVLAIVK